MRTRVRSRFGLVQGMCRVPGHRGRRPARRPDRRGRAGAGRRSPPVPRARRLRPDLLPGSDRGPRPGIPRLDGRLSRLLRARSRSPITTGSARSSPSWAWPGRDRLASRNTLIFMWKNTGGRPAAGASCSGCRSGSGPRCCAGGSSFAGGHDRGPRPARPRSWRRGASWRWAAAAGSSGKRRSFGGFSGRPHAGWVKPTDAMRRHPVGFTHPTKTWTDARRRLMSARALHLVIDARPRGRGACWRPRSCWAGACSVTCSTWPSSWRRRASRSSCTRGPRSTASCASWSASGPVRGSSSSAGRRGPDAAVLRTDRFYDRARLRRRLRRGGSPESAVLWRLDRPEALAIGRRGADPAA